MSYAYPVIYETPETALNRIKEQYEISPYFARKLEKLRGVEIVLLLDDSGSMQQSGSFDKNLNRCLTRWEELIQRIKIIIEITTLFDSDGIDIYFMNREPCFNVKNLQQIDTIFFKLPQGGTPLTATLNKILHDKQCVIEEKKVLIIICTDGEPVEYDDVGRQIDGKINFKKTLVNRKPIENIPISIMICTDEENVLKFFNKIDDEVPYIDVVDDFESEKKEILSVQGSNFVFNLGDYVVKTLIGPLDNELDNLDTKKHKCIVS